MNGNEANEFGSFINIYLANVCAFIIFAVINNVVAVLNTILVTTFLT